MNTAALGLSYNIAVKTDVPIVIFILDVEGVLFPVPVFGDGAVSLSLLQLAVEKEKVKRIVINATKNFRFIIMSFKIEDF
ncbi:hypothetical protein [Flavobacterium chungangense]|uniref:hypothetical protein n=1 Tax=Flavobacterium chungangense TaxID=554283 RepID=UPI000AA64D06|nr:hypothetical protein [Flavobacterium chungangense]